ncbi:MFS transporter [Kiritimatiellota bacterium B12222]|nr:MFS transporter [Kiritimatiellota bacterium B12222]
MNNSSTQTRRNLRISSMDGMLATPWSIISIPGSFLVAGMLNSLFHVGPRWFGVIVAMPALANALSIFLVPWVGRFLMVRELALTLAMMNTGIWLSGLLGLALLPTDQPMQAGLFFSLLYLLLAFTTALSGVGWTSWASVFIPDRIRGRYMARRNIYTNISTLSFMGLSLFLLSFFAGQRWLYVCLMSLAVLGRIVSVLFQHQIHTREPGGGQVCSDTWAKDLWALRQSKALIRYIIFGALAGFCMAWGGAVSTLYAFDLLQVTPANFTAYSITATVAGTLSVRIWGEMIDRHGALPVLIICAICWRICDLGWLVLNEYTKNGLFVVWAWGGTVGTGYMLASFVLLLKLIPGNNRSAGISLNLTVVSIFATIAPMLAGWWLEKGVALEIGHWLLYRGSFAVGIIGGLLSILCLLGLKEPHIHPDRNRIPGALRTLKNLGVAQGLAFFSNDNFVVRKMKNGKLHGPER